MTTFCEPDTTPLRITTAHGGSNACITIEGEADIATLEQLNAALATIELDGVTSVRLDVSELDFVDIPAMRQLTVFARQAKQTGRVITLWGAKPALCMVARLIGVDEELGLR